MWAANAATVSPSLDTTDQRVHLTPANLASSLHRSIEADQVTANLRTLFATPDFHVHDPLPSAVPLTDEGAANHTRLAPDFHTPGLEIFVYGRNALDANQPQPTKYPARQTLQASQAIARRHGLDPARTFFIQQNPTAIDAGVFHNDVISVGHQSVLLVHQNAFVEQPRVLAELQDRFQQLYGQKLTVLEIPTPALSLDDAVASYLFNSQILTTAAGDHVLLCPQDCQTNPAARAVVTGLLAGDFSHGQRPLAAAHFLDLRQSMNNGGGPACLRLRVLLSRQQRAAVRGRVWLDESLYHDLSQWVERAYPQTLAPDDLANPQLAHQAAAALDELMQILEWPPSDESPQPTSGLGAG
jgi:succinylarginine dihydrolase